ncbi:hypothetical protein [Chamaesiphon sp. OTE_75_metabat_556]|uniref:AbiTii domain-containing protein n=1 Tax=Chamaesiphon sp. OTE_75_metabat_556 TaxID=2964692 RepID=UPI00286BF2F6|nr:hypothetical protein [Chamaesiphon sp. OTE_75_metabat_556]
MSDTRNIINPIQADIVNPKADLHSILLKTKVLAYRLKNEDLKNWVRSELDGYDEKHDIPDYRVIRDSVIRGTFFNGVYKHSNRDIGITTVPEEIREGARDIYIYQSVTALEEMAKKEQFWNPLSYKWVQLYNIHTGAVGKFARSDGNTFIQSEQKQSLAKVAEEIQQLLKQLEQTQPTATEEDKINYVSDETTPSFKRRAVAAFIAGSETAIDEFILENKSVDDKFNG